MVGNIRVGNIMFCPSKKDTIAAWKKYHFLNINPFNMIVLKISHAFCFTFIIKQFSKQCFLVGGK